MPALAVRRDLSAEELRRLARREPERREPDRRAAMRLLAIANALGGLSRAEAARSAGMERQAPRDAVPRYNAEGVDGRHDRPRPGRPEGSLPGQQAALKARALRGPGPERGGVSAWRLVDIRAHAGEAHGARCATAAGAWRARSSARPPNFGVEPPMCADAPLSDRVRQPLYCRCIAWFSPQQGEA